MVCKLCNRHKTAAYIVYFLLPGLFPNKDDEGHVGLSAEPACVGVLEGVGV